MATFLPVDLSSAPVSRPAGHADNGAGCAGSRHTSIYRSDRDQIEFAANGILEHPVQRRPIPATFGPADAEIGVDVDHLPPGPAGDVSKFPLLVLGALAGGADPAIDRGTSKDIGFECNPDAHRVKSADPWLREYPRS